MAKYTEQILLKYYADGHRAFGVHNFVLEEKHFTGRIKYIGPVIEIELELPYIAFVPYNNFFGKVFYWGREKTINKKFWFKEKEIRFHKIYDEIIVDCAS